MCVCGEGGREGKENIYIAFSLDMGKCANFDCMNAFPLCLLKSFPRMPVKRVSISCLVECEYPPSLAWWE